MTPQQIRSASPPELCREVAVRIMGITEDKAIAFFDPISSMDTFEEMTTAWEQMGGCWSVGRKMLGYGLIRNSRVAHAGMGLSVRHTIRFVGRSHIFLMRAMLLVLAEREGR